MRPATAGFLAVAAVAAAALVQTNPAGPPASWPVSGAVVGSGWLAPAPPAATRLSHLGVVAVATARGNRGRPDRVWVGAAGRWHRAPFLDAPFEHGRRLVGAASEKWRGLKPPARVAVVHGVGWALLSEEVSGTPGGLLGIDAAVWLTTVTRRSWRRPWTLLTSQLAGHDVLGLVIHASVLLSLGGAVAPAVGASGFYKLYFGSGVAYALAQLVWATAADRPLHSSGPAGTLIGLAAALTSESVSAWAPQGRFALLGVELGPEQLVAALIGLHVLQRGAHALPGCVVAALAGHHLGVFYAAQWRLRAMGTVDAWLDAALGALFY